MSRQAGHTATGGRPAPAAAETGAALASLGGIIASLVPAMMLAYVVLVWPLAFGSSETSVMQEAMGWLAPAGPAEPASPLKQVAYPLLFLLAAACMLTTASYRRIPLANIGIVALVLLVVLALASSLWSAEPALSRTRALLLAIVTATFLAAVFSAVSLRLTMRAILAVFLVATMANLFAVIVREPTALGHPGIYPQKNVFGWVAAMIFFFGLYAVTSGGLARRLAALAMIASSILFLYVSQSKTSLGLAGMAPVLGLVLLYASRRMRLSPALLVPLGLCIAYGVFLLGRAAGYWDLAVLLDFAFGDATFTGRTDLWILAQELMSRGPFLGYGYEAVWGTGDGGVAHSNAVGFTRVAPTGHNGYVDIWLYLGPIGLGLLALYLAAVLATAGGLARIDAALGWLSLTVSIFVLMHNALESDILVSSNPLNMLLLMFFAIGLRVAAAQRAVSR